MLNENWVTENFETDLAVAYQREQCEEGKKTFDLEMHLHLAHVEMLLKQGIISKEEAKLLLGALLNVWEAGPDIIEIREGRVDLYSNLEDYIVKAIGIDVGGKFHIGRSRNDMECTISRMLCRAYLIDFTLSVCGLIESLIKKASDHVDTVMPGYTHHSQHAQPTTMGHVLLWGVDSFLRDIDRADTCFARLNKSPMGAAALCTTGFPVSRAYIAGLLGFSGVVEHSIDAAGSRDFALEMGSVLSIFLSNLNRLSELLLVWNIREVGMIKMAGKHCSYSSIMPQKVNPVGIEMVRFAGTSAYGSLSAMFNNLKGTTPGNGREPGHEDAFLAGIIEAAIPSASYMGDIVADMTVNKERCLQLAKEGFSTMTELADEMVRSKGVSFYMAHKIVSKLALLAVDQNIPCEGITQDLVDGVAMELFNRKINMTDTEIKRAIDPVENVKHHSLPGGPSFEEVKRMLANRVQKVAEIRSDWESRKKYQQSKIAQVKVLANSIIKD